MKQILMLMMIVLMVGCGPKIFKYEKTTVDAVTGDETTESYKGDPQFWMYEQEQRRLASGVIKPTPAPVILATCPTISEAPEAVLTSDSSVISQWLKNQSALIELIEDCERDNTMRLVVATGYKALDPKCQSDKECLARLVAKVTEEREQTNRNRNDAWKAGAIVTVPYAAPFLLGANGYGGSGDNIEINGGIHQEYPGKSGPDIASYGGPGGGSSSGGEGGEAGDGAPGASAHNEGATGITDGDQILNIGSGTVVTSTAGGDTATGVFGQASNKADALAPKSINKNNADAKIEDGNRLLPNF